MEIQQIRSDKNRRNPSKLSILENWTLPNGSGLQYLTAIPGEATNVLPYLSVIIITALLCSTLVALVYLVVRRRREVSNLLRDHKNI